MPHLLFSSAEAPPPQASPPPLDQVSTNLPPQHHPLASFFQSFSNTVPPPLLLLLLLQPGLYSEQQLQARLGQLLLKYRCGLWLSKLPQVYGEMFAQQLHPQALAELHTWTHVCMVGDACPVEALAILPLKMQF